MLSFTVVQFLSHVWLFATPWTAAHRLSCPSLSPRVCLNSCSLSWWCHPIISSYVIPVSSCPQSFQALGSFPVSQLFASGGQSIRASASASVLPMNIQGWFPLGFIDFISLQLKGPPRVLSNTTAQKHQFISGFPCGSAGKESTCNVGDLGSIPGLERSPGEGNSSSILAWRIPWTVESMRSQRVGHD